MPGYEDILRVLYDLETEDRLNHERKMLQSRLTPPAFEVRPFETGWIHRTSRASATPC